MSQVQKKCLALLLMISVLIMGWPGNVEKVLGAEKKQTTRAIGIVFDNSGSMYEGTNMAWCRATYAVEVISAMMNEGDVLQLYPMHDIQVNGTTYSQKNPLVLSGPQEAGKIREVYTPVAAGTPIESIDAAHDGLMATSADEKWLLVLTDGSSFHRNEEELGTGETRRSLQDKFTEYANDVNVLYLGIGNVEAPAVDEETFYQYHAEVAVKSDDVLNKLTEMCNIIFGRDILHTVGNAVSFDLSLQKLIVFVQGDNIDNLDLKDASGTSVGSPDTTYSPRYSEKGSGNYGSTVDKTLQGVMAIYSDLDAGDYTLTYSGSMSSVGVYYEPDVDLTATLFDAHDNPADPMGNVYSGDYVMKYRMVDRYGEPTESELLGNTRYTLNYTINGEEKTAVSDGPGSFEITLAANDTLDGSLSVEYLSGYKITKGFDEIGWPEGGITVILRPLGFLETEVEMLKDEVELSHLEEEPIARVSLFYNGEECTGEQFDVSTMKVMDSEENAQYRVEADGDSFLVYMEYIQDAAHTPAGDYTISFIGTTTDEDGQTIYAESVAEHLNVKDDSRGMAMRLETSQDYYQISEMDKAEPIVVYLTRDGQKMTQEELEAVSLTTEGSVQFRQEIDAERSAIKLYPIREDDLEEGKQEIKVTATTLDEIGNETSAQESTEIEISHLPAWVRVVAISLGILLVLLLFFLYMNMKVLPRKIQMQDATFKVKNKVVSEDGVCKFSSGGKKKGRITVASPDYAMNPDLECSYSLEVEAVSPRYVKSSKRKVKVVKVMPDSACDYVEVASMSFKRNPKTDEFPETESTNFEIFNGATTIIKSLAKMPGTNRKETGVFDASFRFK